MTSKSDEGFFTLEAIVAMMIVALVLVAFNDAASTAFSGLARAKQSEQALTIALAEMNSSSAASLRSRRGKLRAGGAWQLSVVPIFAGRSLAGAPSYTVLVRFVAQDSNGIPIVDFETIKLASR